MQHYELTYIIPVKYSEEEQGKISEQVKDLIFKNEGKITKEGGLGILKLAYPIKQVNQGNYIVLEFDVEPEAAKVIDKELKLMNEVLRHLIVKKTPESEKAMEQALLKEKKAKLEEQREEKTEEKKEETKTSQEKTSEKKKVSIEELDEKLDKILDSDII